MSCLLNGVQPAVNPLPGPAGLVSYLLKAGIGIRNVLFVQCAKLPWPAKALSPMEKISFVLTVPKTSSCPLQQSAPHPNSQNEFSYIFRRTEI